MNLITELQKIESDYSQSSIEITGGLEFSQYQTLRMIDFYSNSRYLVNSGVKREDRPFYNIVNAMVDTAVVATDIDTKDIRVEADDESSYDKSFLFNHELQKWMKESNFAEELNEMGETRARYGGVVVKKCMDEGKLELEVVSWKNLVTDPVDIEGGIVIEKHYMTPVELKKKSDSWSNVDEAIALYAKKGHTRADARIEVWEVEGEFPESYNSENGEAQEGDNFTRQRHFFCVKESKNVHLFWEEQSESQYKYLPWKTVSGRALGRGVVEEGEEAQVWTNDAIQKKQAAMELSGKVILKTNSKKIGNNVRRDMDNGDIIVLEDDKDINVLNLLNGAMPQFTETVQEWFQQYERATASYDSVRGETPPSGQAYRLQALVSQAGSSHFDYRREEWGIFLKELFYDWVFPYLEKKLTKEHILASDFSPEELRKLDEAFATHNANQYAIDKMLSGEIVTGEEYQIALQGYMETIGKNGRRRFLDIPKGYYKDMKAKLSMNVTGENKNKQAAMETLSNLLQTMIPMVQAGIVSGDDTKMVLNKIMELTGTISPLSLSKGNTQAQQGAVQVGQVTQQSMNTEQPLGGQELKQLQPQAVQ